MKEYNTNLDFEEKRIPVSDFSKLTKEDIAALNNNLCCAEGCQYD